MHRYLENLIKISETDPQQFLRLSLLSVLHIGRPRGQCLQFLRINDLKCRYLILGIPEDQ